MRLGFRVGDGCAELHDEMMRFVQVNRMELDEMWSYVGKKQRKVRRPTRPTLAISTCSSASRDPQGDHVVPRRQARGENTNAFLQICAQRIVTRPEISSDGFRPIPMRSSERSARIARSRR